ncbi:MAG: transcriptional regulator [Clostridia bacterium]|nr:transcriptional regulator [Clostridia bacterium]
MEHVSSFPDRLLEQMTLNGYNAQGLAKQIACSHSTIYNLLNDKYKQPSTEIFFSIIEHFNCSADYMLGFLEFPFEGAVYHPPLRIYGARIRELLKARKEKQKTFIENMHISSNLAYQWLSDKALPTIEYLIKLANYFDITVDVFIQRTK